MLLAEKELLGERDLEGIAREESKSSGLSFLDLRVEPPGGVRMDLPAADWTLEELHARALWENEAIKRAKRHAPRYWYLGKVLLVVQGAIGHGNWKRWCDERHINRNRWQRGRHLAMAFESADDVADMTIEAAHDLACELLGIKRRRTAADARLRRSLVRMRTSLEKQLEAFGAIASAAGLRAQIADVRQMLAALDNAAAAHEERDSVLALPRRAKHPK
ncbi:MAG: hypothetical protein ACREHD_30575 [Pirellulales bacterium]